jgi:hypothetical protein
MPPKLIFIGHSLGGLVIKQVRSQFLTDFVWLIGGGLV